MSKGIKYDTSKVRWDLVPIDAIEEVAKILTFGSEKYGDNNWQDVDNFNDRYYAALLRHLVEWRKGNTIDPESGMSHLSHAATNAIFLLWNEMHGMLIKKENKDG